MPREKRGISVSKIYHVFSRGNEKKPIFLEQDDYNQFIDILRRKRKVKPFTIYAYCLMKNHYHLIINEEENNISSIMSSINTTYAIYFNKKYDRVGHLFQGRFKSEAIESEDYLLAAVSYVHNNPVAANLVREASQYAWSSYHAYLKSETNDDLIDSQFVLNIFSPSPDEARPQLENYLNKANGYCFIDLVEIKEETTIKVQKANKIINQYLHERGMNIEKLKLRSNLAARNELINILLKQSGLPMRRIGELIDLSKSTISRVKQLPVGAMIGQESTSSMSPGQKGTSPMSHLGPTEKGEE